MGHRIKTIRKLKRFSQKELARGVISVSYLSAIENNKVSVNKEIISLLAKKLQVKVSIINDAKEYYKWKSF